MTKVRCPGCGAEIDTDTALAVFPPAPTSAPITPAPSDSAQPVTPAAPSPAPSSAPAPVLPQRPPFGFRFKKPPNG